VLRPGRAAILALVGVLEEVPGAVEAIGGAEPVAGEDAGRVGGVFAGLGEELWGDWCGGGVGREGEGMVSDFWKVAQGFWGAGRLKERLQRTANIEIYEPGYN
jgi:hypothetical protein